MFSNFFNQIVSNFGFKCTNDFSNSIVHNKLLILTLPLAGITSIFESMLGLQNLTVMAFLVLILLELITGLIASKVRGEKIVSNKFGRFGLKVLVWMTLLYITNSIRLEYINVENNFDTLASSLFTWLHGTLFIYIVLEYLISVLENLSVITGDSKKSLINTITNKLNSFLGNEKNKRKNKND
jgi:phage-related holin